MLRVFARSYATLSNRAHVLPAINKIIAPLSGNFIEYIYTRPDWSSFAQLNSNVLSKISSQMAQNPYGHSAVRYGFHPTDGTPAKDIVMNISRPQRSGGDRLVNFVEPENYFFSPPGQGNLQGGIFLRSFVTVRIDDVDVESIQQMDRYYQDVQRRNEAGQTDFRLFTAMVSRTLARWWPRSSPNGEAHGIERGNCAYWTSQGLVRAGVLSGLSNWPLVVLFKLILAELNRSSAHAPCRMNVISYRSLKHKHEPQGALIYPFHWLRHSYKPFWALEQLATVVVDPVPEQDGRDGCATSYRLDVTENADAKQRWQRLRQEMMRVHAFTKDLKGKP